MRIAKSCCLEDGEDFIPLKGTADIIAILSAKT
jgi:hypothetical protein